MDRALVEISRRLSRLLRHAPEAYRISLTDEGWAPVEAVLRALHVERAQLEAILRESDKARFELDPEGDRIRAVHGHSVPVTALHPESAPPEVLYHGTVARFLDAIRAEGLRAKQRQAVHLSETVDQAHEVGGRRGAPVILEVRAGAMHVHGHVFRRSTSGVWLTEAVPPDYLRFP